MLSCFQINEHNETHSPIHITECYITYLVLIFRSQEYDGAYENVIIHKSEENVTAMWIWESGQQAAGCSVPSV